MANTPPLLGDKVCIVGTICAVHGNVVEVSLQSDGEVRVLASDVKVLERFEDRKDRVAAVKSFLKPPVGGF